MDKYEKLHQVFNLLNMAFKTCMDLKNDLRAELKEILVCEGAKDIDKIEDVDAYGRALLIEAKMEKLTTQAENMSLCIDELIKIKL